MRDNGQNLTDEQILTISRRAFIKSIALTTAASVFGLHGSIVAEEIGQELTEFGPFVTVYDDNTIEIAVAWAEMGNGTQTVMPMLIAEGLDVDFSNVRVKIVKETDYQRFGSQGAGASAAVRTKWHAMQSFGANIRYLMVKAASEHWGISVTDCESDNGYVINLGNGEQLSYGQLRKLAAKIDYPKEQHLKAKYRNVGQSFGQIAIKDIVRGQTEFGYDVVKPNMLHCYLSRSPWTQAKLMSFNDTSKIDQSIKIVRITGEKADWGSYVFPSVGVISSANWLAQKAKSSLNPIWEPEERQNLPAINELAKFLDNAPVIKQKKGESVEISDNSKVISRRFFLDATTHAQMEPLSCVAKFEPSKQRISVAGSFQNPTAVIHLLARRFELPLKQVLVETSRIGGSFGRKQAMDYVFEAVLVAKQCPDEWVKVYWTREDEFQNAAIRTSFYHQIIATIGEQGDLLNWEHTSLRGDGEGGQPSNEQNSGAYQGQSNFPYLCHTAEFRAGFYRHQFNEASLRAVYYPSNLFAVNCMLSEIAHELNIDEIEYHLTLLGNQTIIAQRTNYFEVEEPNKLENRHVVFDVRRLVNVIQEVKASSKWKQGDGGAWGFACGVCFSSYVAVVVRCSQENKSKIEKVWTAIDCGRVVNLDGVKNQLEGGVVWGISQTFFESVKMSGGKVTNKNFNDYPLARMQDAPAIESVIVKSEHEPTGVGEPVVACISPAIVNALNMGRRDKIRWLPVINKMVMDKA